MLVALNSSGIRSLAALSMRGSDSFICPICHEDVVLKKGSIKIHHFAHYPESTCENAGETEEHKVAKFQLYEFCRNAGWDADVEVLGKGCRADVLAQHNFTKIAFEIQLTKISREEKRRRSSIYRSLGIMDYWIEILPINWEEVYSFLYNNSDPIVCFFNLLNEKYLLFEDAVYVNPSLQACDVSILEAELMEGFKSLDCSPFSIPCHCPNKGNGIVRSNKKLAPLIQITKELPLGWWSRRDRGNSTQEDEREINRAILNSGLPEDEFFRLVSRFSCLKYGRAKPDLCKIGTTIQGL